MKEKIPNYAFVQKGQYKGRGSTFPISVIKRLGLFVLLTIGFMNFSPSLNAQTIQLTDCGANVTLSLTGVDATGRNIYQGIDGGNIVRMEWDNAAMRWECNLFTNTGIFAFEFGSTSFASTPNPPTATANGPNTWSNNCGSTTFGINSNNGGLQDGLTAGCTDAAPPTVTCPTVDFTAQITVQILQIGGNAGDISYTITDAGNNVVASGSTTNNFGPNATNWTLPCDANYTFNYTDNSGGAAQNVQVQVNNVAVLTLNPIATGNYPFTVDPCNAVNANCQLVINNLAPTVSDDCTANPSVTYTLTGATTGSGNTNASGTTFNAGTTTLTYNATDDEGNVGSCSVDITVEDETAPTITCPANVTIACDANTAPASTGMATATDNCDASPAITFSDVTVGSIITRTWTATDIQGNQSTCNQTITLTDTEDPTANCPANQTVNNTAGQCGANVSFSIPNGTDNCSTPTSAANPASGSFFNVGTTQVTVTATDAAGNTGTCTFNVTVNDTENPTANCPGTQTVSNMAGVCGANVSFSIPNPTDNCPGATASANPASGSFFDVGTTPVTVTATDAVGNTSTCTFDVVVNDDEAPTINCPNNINVNAPANQCFATVLYAPPTTSDNCPGETFVCSPVAGSNFNVGTTPVTCTVTDAAGNSANCSFNITVNDVTPPSATCPNDITVNAPQGACGANVAYAGPLVSDACGIAPEGGVICTPASGSFFSVGTTPITCTVMDVNGNSSSCTFNITINDNENPVANCPSTQTVSNDLGVCGANVNFSIPDPSDNCPGATASANPASGSFFDVGTTPVTVTATDAVGNTSTCTFDVVVNDDEAPTMLCNNFNINLTGASTSITAAQMDGGSTDNCGIVGLAATPSNFNCSTLGAQTVSLTGTDAAGNSSTCTGTVTVIDNSAPNAVCANPTVNLTSDGTTTVAASFFDGGSSAVCGGVSFSASQVDFDCNDVGNTIPVTLTVSADNEETATCTANVTVADPNSFCCAAPSAMCNNTTVQLDANGAASVTSTTIGAGSTADCGLALAIVSPSSFDCSNVGNPVTVTYTITDINGASDNCTATVTVEDNIAPVANCPSPGATNILINNSFENGAVFNQPFGTDWNAFGAVFAIDANAIPTAQDGDFYLKIFGGNSGVFQDHPISGGAGLTASVYIRNAAFDPMLPGCTGFVKLEYFDAGGGFISFTESTKLDNTLPQDVWTQVTLNDVAPANAATVRMVVIMQCSAGGAVFFDDASLTIAGSGGGDFVLDNDAGQCGAVLNFSIPTPDDNCSATAVADIPSGSFFDVGTTMVTVTATDGAGNSSQCMFNVTVNDTEAPVAECPAPPGGANILVNNSFEDGAVFNQPFNTDWNTFGAVFAIDANIIPTAQDGDFYLKIFGGNSGVFQDHPISGGDNLNASVYIRNAAFDPMLPGCVGFIKLEYFDAGGAFISVVESNRLDNTLPQDVWTQVTLNDVAPANAATVRFVAIMQCPAGGAVFFDNASLSIDNGGTGDFTFVYDPALCGATVSYNLPASTDNCPGVTTSTNIPSGTFLPVGTSVLVVTATDASGNSSNCSVNVEVEDNIPPVVACLDATVEFNGEDQLTVDVADLYDAANTFDNCSAVTINAAPQTVTCDQLGDVIPVTIEGTDASGNVGSCLATITVAGLPCGWTNSDGINCDGNNDASFDTASETFTVTSDGCSPPFPYTSDSQSFVYQELCGDGYIKALVTNVSGNGFAGVELRNDLDPSSAKIAVGTNTINRVIRIARVLDGYPAWPQEFYSLDKFWVKIERSGPYFRALVSSDDVIYTPVLFQAIQMDACTQVGLFVYSKVAGDVVTADFTNVEIGQGTPFLEAPTSDTEMSASIPSDFNVGLSPNPAKDQVRIDLNELIGQEVNIRIYNINGQVMTQVHYDEVEDATEVIALDRFPTGTYYVNIQTAQNQQTLKLIKQ